MQQLTNLQQDSWCLTIMKTSRTKYKYEQMTAIKATSNPTNKPHPTCKWRGSNWFCHLTRVTNLLTKRLTFYHTLETKLLQDIPYLLDEPRVISQPKITVNVLTETLTHKLKLTHYFLTLWCEFLERTTICCINVFQCSGFEISRPKRNT